MAEETYRRMAVKSDGEQCTKNAEILEVRYGHEVRLCRQHAASFNSRPVGARFGKSS